MSDNCDNLLPEPWFTATVLEREDNPIGFMEWTEGITQDNYNIILPDESRINVRMYIDNNGVFDNGSYTTMLINRYNDLV